MQVCPQLILQVCDRSVVTFIIINHNLSTTWKIMPRVAALDSDLRLEIKKTSRKIWVRTGKGLGERLGLLQGVNLQRRRGRTCDGATPSDTGH